MDMPRRTALTAGLATLGARPLRAQPAAISGTVTYRGRMALPPGTMLEVALLDVSRADAPADRIAEAAIPVTGQVPLRFTLPFEPSRIQAHHAYSVEARIRRGDRILFRSDRITPVLTRGAGREVEILLVQMPRPAADSPPILVGPEWIAEDIGGRGVVDRLKTNMTFSAEGRVSGSGGCNRFTGGYELQGASLRFGQMASTQMACVPAAMEQERRFFEALSGVQGWRLENGILHLTGAGGATLVRLSRGG